MIASGRSSARAAATISVVTSTPVAPVQAMTTSATASSAARSSSGAGRPPYSPASRAARSAVRLTMVIWAAPSRDTVAVASPAMEPAPTTSTRLPAEVADRGADRSSAALTSEGAAQVDVGLGAGALADPEGLLEQHVEGGADGAELLAEAERLAGLAEDLALADGHGVQAGGDLEEVGDGAVVVVHVEVRQDRLGRRRRPARRAAATRPRRCRGSGRRPRRSRAGCRWR